MPNSQSTDDDLLLKRRARRRLLGAVAFAGLAAVVLPMVMDQEPKQQVQDIQIRIPGQNQTTFTPKPDRFVKTPVSESYDKLTEKDTAEDDVGKMAERSADKSPESVTQTIEGTATQKTTKSLEKLAEQKTDKQEKQNHSTKTNDKKSERNVEQAAGKSIEKNQNKAPGQVAKRTRAEEAQRAAAALAGRDVDDVVKKKPSAEKSTAAKSGQYVILIGTFSNEANVKQLQSKLGDLGIRVFTESIESGKKTRVRAGPFASRDAAEKAAEKMKRIGVNGVIAGKP